MANKKTLLASTLDKVMLLYKRDLAVLHTPILSSKLADAGLRSESAGSIVVVSKPEEKNLTVTMAPEHQNEVYDFSYGNSSMQMTPMIQAYLRGDL